MDTISIRPKKEEDSDKAKPMSTKAPLTERIMKKAAAVVLATGIVLGVSACSPEKRELIEFDAGTDAGDVVDGDIDEDGGVTDGDVADADILDGDVDDGGITDADVSDGDVDEDADPGPLCSDVFDEVFTEETFDKGTGREVGGYMITYVSQTVDGLTLDIHCGSDSSEITAGEDIETLVEHTVEVPEDGKRIRITVHSRNTFDATLSVAVEPL